MIADGDIMVMRLSEQAIQGPEFGRDKRAVVVCRIENGSLTLLSALDLYLRITVNSGRKCDYQNISKGH